MLIVGVQEIWLLFGAYVFTLWVLTKDWKESESVAVVGSGIFALALTLLAWVKLV